jgi:hypothetical protein
MIRSCLKDVTNLKSSLFLKTFWFQIWFIDFKMIFYPVLGFRSVVAIQLAQYPNGILITPVQCFCAFVSAWVGADAGKYFVVNIFLSFKGK